MATSHLSILTPISILSLCFSLSSSQTTFTLSLTQHITVPSEEHAQGETNQHPLLRTINYLVSSEEHAQGETNQHPLLRTINYLVSSSLARAHCLKNPSNNSSSFISQIPLFAQGNGEIFNVSLNFGSPSLKLSFIMDTGSSLVWFPCTHRYACHKCHQTNIPVFMPDHTSSAKILGCNNKKCGWVTGPIDPNLCNGTQVCVYEELYGSGSTTGVLLSETLHFPEGDVTDFAVGCSISSTGVPEGIVGFGRGLESLPAQMGLKKFSYCLVSHKFDDKPVSSELVLYRESSNSGAGDGEMSYTKFRKNPSGYEEFYYLTLRKITVGGKRVKIPYAFLVPGSDGNGGTIIDSGSTFTMMDEPIYKLVEEEFKNQISKYKRAPDVEAQSGLRPCYKVGDKPPVFPELMFYFKGGAKLSLPMADYFSSSQESEGNPGVLCLTIISSGSNSSNGSSIIIGNYQQQDIYFEYDLKNERLGFKKKICN